MNRYSECVFHLMAVLVVAAIFAGRASGRGPEATGGVPEDFDSALEAQISELEGTAVSWTRTRRSSLPLPHLLNTLKLPPGNTAILEPQNVTFMVRQGKYYQNWIRKTVELNDDGTIKGLVAVAQEASFDGEKVYGGSRKTSEPRSMNLLIISSIETLRKDEPNRPYFAPGVAFLNETGYWFPSTPIDLGKKPASLYHHFLSQKATVEEIDTPIWKGKSALRIQMRLVDGARVNLWHLKNPGYPLCRRESFNKDGQLLLRTDLDSFAPLLGAPHLVFPRRAVVDHFTWVTLNTERPSATPLLTEVYDASLKRSNMADDQFVIAYTEPGSHIADGSLARAEETKHGRIEYTVPANPEDLDEVIRAATQRATYDPASARTIAIVVVVVVVALVGFVLLWKWRTRSRG